MATKSARSTPTTRAALIQIERDLRDALDSLPGRFWATRSQKDAYQVVIRHLQSWISWEAE